MDNQEKRVFNWVVRQGNIIVFADDDKIHLEINKENYPTCLLTKSDAGEVINILTNMAEDIWHNPDYTREPYKGKQYILDEDGKVYWDISETKIFVGLNDQHDALEIDFQGSNVTKMPVNICVEMVQILTHFSNKL